MDFSRTTPFERFLPYDGKYTHVASDLDTDIPAEETFFVRLGADILMTRDDWFLLKEEGEHFNLGDFLLEKLKKGEVILSGESYTPGCGHPDGMELDTQLYNIPIFIKKED